MAKGCTWPLMGPEQEPEGAPVVGLHNGGQWGALSCPRPLLQTEQRWLWLSCVRGIPRQTRPAGRRERPGLLVGTLCAQHARGRTASVLVS